MTAGPDGGPPLCDHCRLPCSEGAIVSRHDGVEYTFCTEACRDALESSESVFTEHHAHRRYAPRVAALEHMLPKGIPRNSMVMLSDEAGTRTEALQVELAWRALRAGEPVVMMSFLEPPVSVVQQFVSLGWNVLPHLESEQLHLLDCFTYQMTDRQRMYDRLSDWNRHLDGIARPSTTTVEAPSEVNRLESRLDGCLERMEMHDRGVLVIDSLTELGSLVQPVKAYRFVKDVRADVAKGRFVPIFAGATVSDDGSNYPHDMMYLFDGVVDIRLNPELVDRALVKELRVRKMSGVDAIPRWTPYEFQAGRGLTPVAIESESGHDDRAGDGQPGGEQTGADAESGRGPDPGRDSTGDAHSGTGRETGGDGAP